MELKKQLPASELERHPARFALVELVNIHDSGVSFEPIHRMIFQTDVSNWFDSAKEHLCDPNGREIVLLCGKEQRAMPAKGSTIGETIGLVEQFCKEYCARHGGRIDYIHGDDETRYLAQSPGCCGMLLPQMEKTELFQSVSSAFFGIVNAVRNIKIH